MLALIVSMALVMNAGPQAAVASPPSQEPSQLEDVTVEGRRLAGVVQGFVGEVSAPARNRGLARWQRSICVGVVNLRGTAARYMADRVSEVALELGLEPGEPGCEPNILIVATDDSDAIAEALVSERRRVLIAGGSGMDRGLRALDEFRNSSAPVRWWHVSMPVNAETGERAVRLPGDENPPTVSKFAASRLQSPLRDDLIKAMVIVDVSRIGETSFEQLTDYVAMVALTQIDPDAETSEYDTILNAFREPARTAPRLTDWDTDYLTALYTSSSNRLNPRARDRAVADRMTRDRIRAQD